MIKKKLSLREQVRELKKQLATETEAYQKSRERYLEEISQLTEQNRAAEERLSDLYRQISESLVAH